MARCVHCGTENAQDAVFCNNCGKRVTEPVTQSPRPAPSAGGGAAGKTIISMPAAAAAPQPAQAPRPSTPQQASPASAAAAGKTIISMPAPKQASQPAPAAQPEAQPASGGEDKKTIFGMPAMKAMPQDPKVEPKLFTPPGTGQQAQPAFKKADIAGRTMIGHAPVAASQKAPVVAAQPVPVQPAPQPQYQQPTPQPAPQHPVQQPVPQPFAQQPVVQPMQSQYGPAAAPPRVEQAPLATPGPMPQPQYQQPAPQPQYQQPAPQPQYQQPAPPQSQLVPQHGQVAPSAAAAPQQTSVRPRKSAIGSTTMMMLQKTTKMPKWLFFVIPLVLVLAAGAVFGGIYLKKMYLDPRVENIVLAQGADFQTVDIEADLVNPGDAAKIVVSKLQFPVKDGKLKMTLPIGPVVLGPNNIAGMLVNAKGEELGEVAMSFDLDMYWQPVLGALNEEPPLVIVSFQTLPNNSVTIDGEAPAGEKAGQYEWRKPVKELLSKAPPTSGDKWAIEVPYELKAKGTVLKTGTLKWEIPAVHLTLNRPADGGKVADDYVFCSGLTEPDTEVRVNGAPVGELVDNVFTVKVPLPTVGEHKIVVDAVSPRRGPRQLVLTVIRMESLDAEIEEFTAGIDKDLGWESLARDPDTFKGKKVSLHGRIISFKTTQGVSAFQLLVDEGCPPEARCMLKVDFKGETNAGKDSWVTVLGEVAGKFTIETSDKKTFDVPAMQASFVVRDEEESAKKSKKKKGK